MSHPDPCYDPENSYEDDDMAYHDDTADPNYDDHDDFFEDFWEDFFEDLDVDDLLDVVTSSSDGGGGKSINCLVFWANSGLFISSLDTLLVNRSTSLYKK